MRPFAENSFDSSTSLDHPHGAAALGRGCSSARSANPARTGLRSRKRTAAHECDLSCTQNGMPLMMHTETTIVECEEETIGRRSGTVGRACHSRRERAPRTYHRRAARAGCRPSPRIRRALHKRPGGGLRTVRNQQAVRRRPHQLPAARGSPGTAAPRRPLSRKAGRRFASAPDGSCARSIYWRHRK